MSQQVENIYIYEELFGQGNKNHFLFQKQKKKMEMT